MGLEQARRPAGLQDSSCLPVSELLRTLS